MSMCGCAQKATGPSERCKLDTTVSDARGLDVRPCNMEYDIFKHHATQRNVTPGYEETTPVAAAISKCDSYTWLFVRAVKISG